MDFDKALAKADKPWVLPVTVIAFGVLCWYAWPYHKSEAHHAASIAYPGDYGQRVVLWVPRDENDPDARPDLVHNTDEEFYARVNAEYERDKTFREANLYSERKL